jgi:predicted AlkP superfamily phosphohydrolase/phosphomutase
MWLTTDKGKEFRQRVQENAEPVFDEIKKNLKRLEGPTREMYEALVERAVAEYAAKRELAEDMQNALIKNLKKRWRDIQRAL